MRRLFRIVVMVGLLTVLAAQTLPAAVAQDTGSPDAVIERETVQAKLSPTGEVGKARLYSQLLVQGNGVFTLFDPTSTRNLRNLEGFRRPSVTADGASWTVSVDGEKLQRTVADFDKELPVAIEASYLLNDELVEPRDLVGRSGLMTATFTIRNTSGTPMEISYKDGSHNTITETVDVLLPLVGSFGMTLDRRFSSIDAPGAVLAGDGRGGTRLAWSLAMFEPLGAAEQQLIYQARVRDAVVPSASLQAIPVTADQAPLDSAETAFFEATRDTRALTAGAAQIDRGAIRLAMGAGQVLDGMVRLSEGADALRAGLGRAAAGSRELADGLVQADSGGSELATGLVTLRDGSGRLSAGVGQASTGGQELAGGLGALRAGSAELAAGLGQASSGSRDLAVGGEQLAAGAGAASAGAAAVLAGLEQIEGGLHTLADAQQGLPAAQAGAQTLQAGVAQLRAALGAPGQPDTVLDGMARLGAGLGSARSGVGQVSTGLGEVDGGLAGLQTLATEQAATLQAARDSLDCAALPAVCGAIDAVLAHPDLGLQTRTQGGLAALRTGVGQARTGLSAIHSGLGTAIGGVSALQSGLTEMAGRIRSNDAVSPGLYEGLGALVDGLAAAVEGVGQLAAGSTMAVDGQGQLKAGLDQLAAGTTTLSSGATQLSVGLGQLDAGGQQLAGGAAQAAEGSSRLSAGLIELDAGGKELAAGAARAAEGSSVLSSGLGRLAAGGRELSSGLGDAASGSATLADGLKTATIGGRQVADGLERLQVTGTSQLAASVSDGSGEQARKVALIQAMAERAQTEGLPYGAPEGAQGTAAYSFDLSGVTPAARENILRLGLTALMLVAMAGVVVVQRRRLLPMSAG